MVQRLPRPRFRTGLALLAALWPCAAMERAARPEPLQPPLSAEQAGLARARADLLEADQQLFSLYRLSLDYAPLGATDAGRDRFNDILTDSGDPPSPQEVAAWLHWLSGQEAVSWHVPLTELALALHTVRASLPEGPDPIPAAAVRVLHAAIEAQMELLQRREGPYGAVDPMDNAMAVHHLLWALEARQDRFSSGRPAQKLAMRLFRLLRDQSAELSPEMASELLSGSLKHLTQGRDLGTYRALVQESLPARSPIQQAAWALVLNRFKDDPDFRLEDLVAWLRLPLAAQDTGNTTLQTLSFTFRVVQDLSARLSPGRPHQAVARFEADLKGLMNRMLAPGAAAPPNQQAALPVNQQAAIPVNQQAAIPVNQQAAYPVNQQAAAPVNPKAAVPAAPNLAAAAQGLPAEAWSARTLVAVTEGGERFAYGAGAAGSLEACLGALPRATRRKVTSLDLTGRLETEDLAIIVRLLPLLRRLDLSHAWHVNELPVPCPGGLDQLAALAKLEHLVLRDVNMGLHNLDRLETAVAGCPNLARLDLEGRMRSRFKDERLDRLAEVLRARGGGLTLH